MYFSRAVGGRCAGAAAGQLSVFPDPKLSSPLLPAPPYPSRFPENIVPITSENSRARTKGPTSFFLPVPFASKP